MPANYVLLEKITVGAAGAASVTFSSIPQTGYTDLVIKGSARSLRASDEDGLAFGINGAGATNWLLLSGNGSSASSGTLSSLGFGAAFIGRIPGANATANTFGNFELYLPNYTSSSAKSYSIDAVTENNGSTAYSSFLTAYQSNTAAVSSVILLASNANLAANSTFYLYGVAKLGTTPAIVPYATGGDTIMTDGTYWYHSFLSSGTFTPAKPITCDYLVVAGGAGGTGSFVPNGYGGPGAGGLRSTVTATGGGGSLESAVSLNSGTAYTVTIGAGGAAGGSSGSSGNNSSLAGTGLTTITSVGGGRRNTTGGSGGGGSYDPDSYGLGTAGQGYRGGNGFIVGGGDTLGGGGGGAGAVGANATSTVAGSGGAGVQITAFATPTATGVSGFYAGGGGASAEASGRTAGTGGSGGGGNGGVAAGNATSATANTGSGGGAAGSGTGGSGGSGLVIVRYAV
jgi:hypothetical protein